MPGFEQIPERFPGAGTLVKGIQIMETIAAEDRPCTSRHLLEATGLPKATLYRLLSALTEFRYVSHDLRLRTYTIGPRLVELSRSALSTSDLRSAAEHELTRLTQRLGETTALVVQDGGDIVNMDVRRGPHPLAVGIEIGRRLPAIEAASGQAILAAMPPHEAHSFLAHRPAEERARLMSDIAISRARGYTIAASRSIPGAVIIAVPIQLTTGGQRGAITLTALEDRLSLEQRHVIGRDLMEAARRVMGSFGTSSVAISPNPRPSCPISPDLECVVPAGNIVGEGPVWDTRRALLRWVDMAAPAFHNYDPATGEHSVVEAAQLVSAVLPADDGGYFAITQNGLERLDPGSGLTTPVHDPEAHLPGNRFNDAKTDCHGRIWSASMSLDASMPTGSLYRFDRPTISHAVEGGFQVSNGLGWSPDDRVFYFTDTALGTVFAYDHDAETGALSGRRTFVRFEPREGRPDGLAVDAEGHLWIALWDGWRVARYAPDGTPSGGIDMPVPRPTSCCFGGPGLTNLYITSARIRLPGHALEEAPLSGGLFRIAPGVAGHPVSEVAT